MNFKEILHNTLSIQTASGETERMNRYIDRFAKKIPGTTIMWDNGNIYITKGQSDVYPCLVSHTDTVHNIEPKFFVMKSEDKYYGWDGESQVGVGGDDKVGVAMCLWFLQEMPYVKVAFFRDEETGCTGSRKARLDFFEDASMVIQCDRQGRSDIANRIMGRQQISDELFEALEPLIKKYGRTPVSGGMTDVWMLRGLGLTCSSMNLSCGYYSPHTSREFVVINHVIETRDFIQDVFQEHGHKRWEFPLEIESKSWYNRQEEEEEEETSSERPRFIELDYSTYTSWSTPPESSDDSICCPFCGNDALIWDSVEDEFFCMTCQLYIDEDGMMGCHAL